MQTIENQLPEPYFVLYGIHLWPKDSSFAGIKADSIQYPYYKGGFESLYRFFMEHTALLSYKDSRQYTGIVRAELSFDSAGMLTNATIIDSRDGIAAKECKNALLQIPDWQPLLIDGIPHSFKVKIFAPHADEIITTDDGYFILCKRRFVVNGTTDYEKSGVTILDKEELQDFKDKGIKLLQKKDFENAKKMFSFYLKWESNDLDCLFNRALCNYKLNLLNLACEDWTKAARLGDKESEDLVDKKCK